MSPTPKPSKPTPSTLVTKKMAKQEKKTEGMIIYLNDMEDEPRAYFCDHPVLQGKKGFHKDESFVTEEMESMMEALLKECPKDGMYRKHVDVNEFRSAILADFAECFGRDAKEGDLVCGCVSVLIRM